MYSHIEEDKLRAITYVGEDVFNLMIDVAHNYGETKEELMDITEDQWAAIAIWEKHLKESIMGTISNINFDLEVK